MGSNDYRNINIPGSKSYAHRALFASFFCCNETSISNIPLNDDVLTTIELLNVLGAKTNLNKQDKEIRVNNILERKDVVEVNVNESASTLRMAVPLLTYLCNKSIIKMNDSLAKRPLGIIKNFFEENNIDYSFKDNILTLGHINEFKDIIEIDASVSSQLISGLLFVLPILDKEQTIIKLQNEIVSLNYILMTLKTLSDFGINVSFNGKELIIPGRQKYIANNYIVEGDYSSTSSFIVYALNKNPLLIKGLNKDSLQGDKSILSLLYFNKCKFSFDESGLLIFPNKIKTFFINIKDCIDLGPSLFIMAALSSNECIINGVSRLKIKESNRLNLMINGLKHFNIEIEEIDDYCIVKPSNICYDNEVVETGNDHRIIMAFLTLGKILNIDVKLSSIDGLSKSYPEFLYDLNGLE